MFIFVCEPLGHCREDYRYSVYLWFVQIFVEDLFSASYTYTLDTLVYAPLTSNAPTTLSLATTQILIRMDSLIATEERFVAVLEGHITQAGAHLIINAILIQSFF